MSSAKTKILLVEDEVNFGDVLKSYLEMNDYEVELASDGEKGLEFFKKDKYDICILDVMMPKKDGFELAKDIRAFSPSTPIIFLTAKNLKEDIVKGFQIGADDYITKPFNSEELLYRVQAILKRSGVTEVFREEKKEYQIGNYHFNYPLRVLTLGDKKFKLSPKEASLLKMFSQRENDILPRVEALTEIWGEDSYFTARSMDVFVTKLRKYLKDDPDIEIINIHGNGFQLLVNSK